MPLNEALGAFLDFYRSGGRCAVFLDFDGTLAPIVEHPNLSRLAPGTRRLLGLLAAVPRLQVAVISSRRLDDLRRMRFSKAVHLAGNAGLEMRLQGRRIVHPRAMTSVAPVAELRELLLLAVEPFTGAWLEDKRFSLTVHYRRLAADRIGSLHATIDSLVSRWREPLRVVPGPMAIEISLDLAWTKANCIGFLLRKSPVEGQGVLYAGDSANDTEALRLVAQMNGISIGIGPQAPDTARYRLSTPADVVTLMARLLKAIRAQPPFVAAAQA